MAHYEPIKTREEKLELYRNNFAFKKMIESKKTQKKELHMHTNKLTTSPRLGRISSVPTLLTLCDKLNYSYSFKIIFLYVATNFTISMDTALARMRPEVKDSVWEREIDMNFFVTLKKH